MTWNPTPKEILEGISLSDHMGDVNDYLPPLARALGLPEPEWHDELERMVFPWEDIEDEIAALDREDD